MQKKDWKVGGILPDKKDRRDYIIRAPRGPLKAADSCDLRQYAREIENQGGVGSCVGNATSSCLELYAKSKLTQDKNFSRLFVYWNARDLGGIVGDEGAYIRDGLKSCNRWGICEENHWDYIESKVNDAPDANAYEEARKNRVITYERIQNDNREVFKSTLLGGRSIVIGIGLARSFYDIDGPLADQDYTGVSSDNEFIGGHAMNIVGYDDNLNGGSYIVENSWGTDWGDAGYFALKYTVWEKDAYDAWVCTDLKIDMSPSDPDYVPAGEPPEPVPPTFEEVTQEFIEEAKNFFSGATNPGGK